MLYFGLQKPVLFKSYFGANVLIMIFINLAYGFSRSGIDNSAHIGGLIGGFLATGAVSTSDKTKWYLNRFIYIAVTLAVVVSSLLYGFGNQESKVTLKVNEMQKFIDKEQWTEVVEKAQDILELGPKKETNSVYAYWGLIWGQIYTGKLDEAVKSSKKLTEIAPREGHYLSGVVYLYLGMYQESRNEISEAKELKPDHLELDDKLLKMDEALKSVGY